MIKLQVPLLKRDIGLGGLLEKSLSKINVTSCGGCKKRKETLDNALTFVPRKKNASRPV